MINNQPYFSFINFAISQIFAENRIVTIHRHFSLVIIAALDFLSETAHHKEVCYVI